MSSVICTQSRSGNKGKLLNYNLVNEQEKCPNTCMKR